MNTSALAVIVAAPDSLRYSLQALLARLPQIAEVRALEHALPAALWELQPRLAVLDADLLRDKAEPLLAHIKGLLPRTRIVLLADQIDQQQILQTFAVDLVVLKGHPAADLFAQIEQLLAQDRPGIADEDSR